MSRFDRIEDLFPDGEVDVFGSADDFCKENGFECGECPNKIECDKEKDWGEDEDWEEDEE